MRINFTILVKQISQALKLMVEIQQAKFTQIKLKQYKCNYGKPRLFLRACYFFQMKRLYINHLLLN